MTLQHLHAGHQMPSSCSGETMQHGRASPADKAHPFLAPMHMLIQYGTQNLFSDTADGSMPLQLAPQFQGEQHVTAGEKCRDTCSRRVLR